MDRNPDPRAPRIAQGVEDVVALEPVETEGREVHGEAARGPGPEDLREVGVMGRLAAADGDLEDAHPGQVVEDLLDPGERRMAPRLRRSLVAEGAAVAAEIRDLDIDQFGGGGLFVGTRGGPELGAGALGVADDGRAVALPVTDLGEVDDDAVALEAGMDGLGVVVVGDVGDGVGQKEGEPLGQAHLEPVGDGKPAGRVHLHVGLEGPGGLPGLGDAELVQGRADLQRRMVRKPGHVVPHRPEEQHRLVVGGSEDEVVPAAIAICGPVDRIRAKGDLDPGVLHRVKHDRMRRRGVGRAAEADRGDIHGAVSRKVAAETICLRPEGIGNQAAQATDVERSRGAEVQGDVATRSVTSACRRSKTRAAKAPRLARAMGRSASSMSSRSP